MRRRFAGSAESQGKAKGVENRRRLHPTDVDKAETEGPRRPEPQEQGEMRCDSGRLKGERKQLVSLDMEL